MVQALIVVGIMLAAIIFLLVLLAANYLFNPRYRVIFKRRIYPVLITLMVVLVFSLAGWFGSDGLESMLNSFKTAAREVGLYFQQGSAQAYDVVVLGGDPEGISAAVAAAREGSDTLLVVQRQRLGGIISYSWLNMLDMNYNPQKELLTQGIFEEFFAAMGDTAFDVGEAQSFFEKMVKKEKKLTVLYQHKFVSPIIGWDGETLVGLTLKNDRRIKKYFGKRFIDATQDADLAAAAGAKYTVGGEDIGWDRTMAATLIFKVAGVDWQQVRKALNGDDSAMTGSIGSAAWGFEKEISAYRPTNESFRLRGLNLGRQNDGSVMINALQIFGVDGLDPASRQQALQSARQEVKRIVPYLKDNVPGFSEASLAATAPELYIRETRHIMGKYRLTINDVLENKDFSDRIAIASYPVDIQAMSPDDWGNVVGNPVQYAIPFRSLVVQEVKNLLVVGRSASYSSLAAGSTRVVPVGMVTGQAAGVAAAYAADYNITTNQLASDPVQLRRVQENLLVQGAYLTPFEIKNPQRNHWAYDAVRALRPMGLVMVGYNNEFSFEDQFTTSQFVRLLYQALSIALPNETLDREAMFALADDSLLTGEKLFKVLTVVHRLPKYYQSYDAKEVYRLMTDLGMISYEFQQRYKPDQPLTRGQVYTVILDTIRYLKNRAVN